MIKSKIKIWTKRNNSVFDSLSRDQLNKEIGDTPPVGYYYPNYAIFDK